MPTIPLKLDCFSFPNSVWECLPRRSALYFYDGDNNALRCTICMMQPVM
ncbi:MAG: hypothetical protein KAI83_19460 [Thiomargarita sp.]|nr:hypothetical protein [Thiomargarita sp.]